LTNCLVYFSFFWSTKKKICPVSDLFCSLSWIFCPVFFKKWEIDRTIGRPRDWPKPHFQKRLDKKFKRVNKKDLILDKFFFGRPKKMRNRPDNWSTKRLTKTTWTGLLCTQIVFCFCFDVQNNLCTQHVLSLQFSSCFHELNLYFNEQSFVILWVSWCKNKCFWKRFTCTVHIF
jgi:hypothetical protein